MLVPVLWLMALLQNEVPPNVATIEGVNPEAAGDLLLKGRAHGVIESVTRDRGLDPPGIVRLKLRERPYGVSGGCLRKEWRATFRSEPGAAEESAILDRAYATTEVSLPALPDCSKGEFAQVGPGLTPDEALEALRRLQAVRNGKTNSRFSCSDSTGSTICSAPDTTRQELAALPAWAVTRKGGESLEFWLGEAGGEVVTVVNFSEIEPHHVTVERRIPPPF